MPALICLHAKPEHKTGNSKSGSERAQRTLTITVALSACLTRSRTRHDSLQCEQADMVLVCSIHVAARGERADPCRLSTASTGFVFLKLPVLVRREVIKTWMI